MEHSDHNSTHSACPFCMRPVAHTDMEKHILESHPNAGAARDIKAREEGPNINTPGFQYRGQDDMADA